MNLTALRAAAPMALVLSLLVARLDAAPVHKDLSDEEYLLRLEESWNQAHIRGDADALANLWAEEIVIIVPKMRILSRSDALALVRSGRMRFERYETTEVLVRVYGDAALVSGRLKRSRVLGGNVMNDDWQFTKSYIRQQRQWRVVAFHASDAPE